jgi:hypothetical protein
MGVFDRDPEGEESSNTHKITDIHHSVSFRLPDLPVGKSIYRGPDEVMRLWAAFRSLWDELRRDELWHRSRSLVCGPQ